MLKTSQFGGFVMFGMIHRSARDMVLAQFGQTAWDTILAKAALDDSAFVSGESYPDEVTFRLITTAAEVANLSVDDTLFAFGEHWVATAWTGPYSTVLTVLGRTLSDALTNLDRMHASIQIAMPDASLPQFSILNEDETSIEIEYFSERQGLENFVRGLFSGLMKKFAVTGEVIFAPSPDGSRIFKIMFSK
jgi:Haem-NO-binding